MHDANPYAPPKTSKDVRPDSASTGARWRGPAIPIALGALIGGGFGVWLLVGENLLGFVGVFFGSVLGGLCYRLQSRNWPIDTTARQRRLRYAFFATTSLPAVTAVATGIRGQGIGMTLVALLIGLSFGLAIVVSGDRRPK